jgi:transposase-like protein
MSSVLSAAHFHQEQAAYDFVEARLWPMGPVCPHCGAGKDRVGKLQGKTTRFGLYKCYACRKPFTVKIGTIFESSHAPLRYWLQAIYLICASKKGISTRQLQRTLGVGMKTAWFMGMRIREAMGESFPEPMGGEGQIVEADETYLGRKPGRKKHVGTGHKNVVLSLVTRGGSARSFHVDGASAKDVVPVLLRNVYRTTQMMTDEGGQYHRLADYFAGHDFVTHSRDEYVRGNTHTNTIEGFFSIFKRGMRGVYQHCSEKHLQRYLNEFDFRYSNREKLGVDDVERADRALLGVKGKRLTYRTTHSAKA